MKYLREMAFRPSKEIKDKAITYFTNLLKKTNPELSPQELLTKANLRGR
jgi:hypothetical protein